jgi:hypothetical protein
MCGTRCRLDHYSDHLFPRLIKVRYMFGKIYPSQCRHHPSQDHAGDRILFPQQKTLAGDPKCFTGNRVCGRSAQSLLQCQAGNQTYALYQAFVQSLVIGELSKDHVVIPVNLRRPGPSGNRQVYGFFKTVRYIA